METLFLAILIGLLCGLLCTVLYEDRKHFGRSFAMNSLRFFAMISLVFVLIIIFGGIPDDWSRVLVIVGMFVIWFLIGKLWDRWWPLDEDNKKKKVIDLSDRTQYPASVLGDIDHTFALGDDSQNMISFIKEKWSQPMFHWGWDDITHEAAVNTDFLLRAFCSLNEQWRERRDAMIAAEGYRFVWKNKLLEPVPGLLSGEEFCDIMNRCLERSLNSIKYINAYDDREVRRWKLNPTYDDLMAELEKDEEETDYYHCDLGCGMHRFSNKAWGNKQLFIVNTALTQAFTIADAKGKLVGFTKDDIDWDSVSQLENTGDAYRMVTSYYFGIEDYHDGLARVNWMLYPDGRYFADEDGFGMEDNDETNVYAYIDTECRVVVKFQDKKDLEKNKALYLEAIKNKGGNE